MSSLTWKKFRPLTDQNAFICLVDSMGDDSSIVQAARVSYGKDEREEDDYEKVSNITGHPRNSIVEVDTGGIQVIRYKLDTGKWNTILNKDWILYHEKQESKDRALIRYLLNHGHTTPFEMVEIKFMVQVPMDCWRQWIRHRTASVNEYSTRYTEALDFFQVTDPSEWRLQATDNKQGSSGFLEEWPEEHNFSDIGWPFDIDGKRSIEKQGPGDFLTKAERKYHRIANSLYRMRLKLGIAKEQARKDLPLSTYTRAYWKCDLHNIFNFLRLRMDSHAQLEIRQFANCMFEIVKGICPVACEAFEDYVLNAKKFSRMEMEIIRTYFHLQSFSQDVEDGAIDKPSCMTDREWKEFQAKVS